MSECIDLDTLPKECIEGHRARIHRLGHTNVHTKFLVQIRRAYTHLSALESYDRHRHCLSSRNYIDSSLEDDLKRSPSGLYTQRISIVIFSAEVLLVPDDPPLTSGHRSKKQLARQSEKCDDGGEHPEAVHVCWYALVQTIEG